MKQSLQLRLGQQLTMTPQLQQAIRLLQLSTLDLQQEIQEALDSNLMLETSDGDNDGEQIEELNGQRNEPDRTPGNGEDSEIRMESERISEDLPVDTDWQDVYDSYLPGGQGQGAGGDEQPDILSHRSATPTLRQHLVAQLELEIFSATDRAIADAIIDAIDADGYLSQSIEDLLEALQPLPVEEDEVRMVLRRVQNLEPAGIGARNLQECLLLQLQAMPVGSLVREHALKICRDHFNLLAAQNFPQLVRKLKIDQQQLGNALALIRSLNPRPGTQIAGNDPEYVIPDVIVRKKSGHWHVELNPEIAPKIRINRDYSALIRRADKSDDNTVLKNHLQEARWFIKSLQSRNETVLRVASKIVEYQQGFLEHGEEAMKPMVLRDIAEALELHESTISRVTTQKYMYTPKGTYEFKYFFSSQVSTSSGAGASSTAIRALIKKLVAAELPGKPLSDNKIAGILAEQGIEVARRTVAKYRESMGIPPSNERKRLL